MFLAIRLFKVELTLHIKRRATPMPCRVGWMEKYWRV